MATLSYPLPHPHVSDTVTCPPVLPAALFPWRCLPSFVSQIPLMVHRARYTILTSTGTRTLQIHEPGNTCDIIPPQRRLPHRKKELGKPYRRFSTSWEPSPEY